MTLKPSSKPFAPPETDIDSVGTVELKSLFNKFIPFDLDMLIKDQIFIENSITVASIKSYLIGSDDNYDIFINDDLHHHNWFPEPIRISKKTKNFLGNIYLQLMSVIYIFKL
jgi:hypothetical protein